MENPMRPVRNCTPFLLYINEATICNAWFEKKAAHTWQHPSTKQWHCIDFVIMREAGGRH